MRTTSKSVLKNKLQILSEEQHAEPPVVTIVDGCALMWTVSWPAPPAKVSAFTTAVVAKIWKRMGTTQVLHVVFDRYNKMSIKSTCRTARQDGCSRVFKLNDEAPLPGQALSLNVAANKEQLIWLLVKHLCNLIVPFGKRLVVTGPDAHPIEVGVGALPRAITHEEADIIMVYHMIEESVGGHSSIRVVSDDTYVLLIFAHHLQARTNNLPATVKVTMEACSGRHTVIDVNAIVQQHSAVVPNLLAAHALTGCDTTFLWPILAKQLFSNACRPSTNVCDLVKENISQMKYSLPVNDLRLPVMGNIHRCRWRRCVRGCLQERLSESG